MKKTLTVIVLSLIFVSSFAQNHNLDLKNTVEKTLDRVKNNNIWVLDTIYGFTGYDTDQWEFDQTEIIKNRNDMGQPIEIVTTEKLNASTWVNVYQGIFSYFSNDSVYEYKVKEWNDHTNNWNTELSYYKIFNEDGVLHELFIRYWDNTDQYFYQGNKELYTYNIDGLVFTKEDRNWNELSSIWEDWSMTYHYYDLNNNDTLIIQEITDGSGGWRNYSRIKNTYNAQNQLILSQEWIYDNYYQEWVDYSKTEYTYYDNGLLEEEFTERYDYNVPEWYDLARSTYIYNSDNLIDSLLYDDLELIDNSERTKYTYNDYLDETGFKIYEYNDGDWDKYYEVVYTYDNYRNQTSYYSQWTDFQSGNWVNGLKEEYYWNTFQTNLIPISNSELKIFPNPVSNVLSIKTTDDICVQIYNSAGILCLSSNNTTIDVSSLEKGIYFVHVKNNVSSVTKKIIIE